MQIMQIGQLVHESIWYEGHNVNWHECLLDLSFYFLGQLITANINFIECTFIGRAKPCLILPAALYYSRFVLFLAGPHTLPLKIQITRSLSIHTATFFHNYDCFANSFKKGRAIFITRLSKESLCSFRCSVCVCGYVCSSLKIKLTNKRSFF